METEHTEQVEPRATRRYEIVNAETGEPVEGTSFVLTPTGEQMHLLSDERRCVGPLHLGIYYWGNIEDAPGPGGPKGEEIIKSLALYYIIERSLDNLAHDFPKAGSSPVARNLRHIAKCALDLAERLCPQEEDEDEGFDSPEYIHW